MKTMREIFLGIAFLFSLLSTITLFAMQGYYGGDGGFVVGGLFAFILTIIFGVMVHEE